MFDKRYQVGVTFFAVKIFPNRVDPPHRIRTRISCLVLNKFVNQIYVCAALLLLLVDSFYICMLSLKDQT